MFTESMIQYYCLQRTHSCFKHRSTRCDLAMLCAENCQHFYKHILQVFTECQLCALKTIIHLLSHSVRQNLHGRMLFQESSEPCPQYSLTPLCVSTHIKAKLGLVTSFDNRTFARAMQQRLDACLHTGSCPLERIGSSTEPSLHTARKPQWPQRQAHVNEDLEPWLHLSSQVAASPSCQAHE